MKKFLVSLMISLLLFPSLTWAHASEAPQWEPPIGTNPYTGDQTLVAHSDIPIDRDPTDELTGVYIALFSAQEVLEGMTFQSYLDRLARMGITGTLQLCHTYCDTYESPIDSFPLWQRILLSVNPDKSYVDFMPPYPYHDVMVVRFCESAYICLYGPRHDAPVSDERCWNIFRHLEPPMGACAQTIWDQVVLFARLYMENPYRTGVYDTPWSPPFVSTTYMEIPMQKFWRYLGDEEPYSLTASEAFILLEEELVDLEGIPEGDRGFLPLP